MKLGIVFPQTEFGSDPGAIREYAQTAEALGYTHILAYDHVLGASPDRPGGWSGRYSHVDAFFEPFVLFAHMAAVTRTLEFITGILILPQRQTALVAKQAATLDVLCGGRFRLGIGVGWNEVEYEALGEDFHTRGRRSEEQVDVLQRLWTEPVVTYAGRWHTISAAGLNPMPVQRPIPIWFGGHADVVLERVARVGDGWLPNIRSGAEAAASLALLDRYLAEHERSRAEIGIEPRLHYGDGNAATWRHLIEDWRAAGATHMTLNTMGCGLAGPQQHMEAMEKFAGAVLQAK